jgi:hypothetical protein
LGGCYEDRLALKTGLIAGGVVVAIVTSIVGIALLSSGREDCGTVTQPSPTANANFAACVDRNIHSGPDAGALALAIGGPLVGGVLAVAGCAIDPDPVDLVERRRLADNDNQEPREGGKVRMVATDGHRLALVERGLRERDSSGPGSDVPEIQIRPMLGTSGAGLSIAVPL